MNKLLIALVAAAFGATAWAQGAAPAGAANSAPAAAQTAPANAGGAAKKADVAKSAPKHRKKAKKSTVHLGIKAKAMK